MTVKYSDESVDKCLAVIDAHTRAGELWSLHDLAAWVNLHYSAVRAIVAAELVARDIVKIAVPACWTGRGRLPALYSMTEEFAHSCEDFELYLGFLAVCERVAEAKVYRAKYTWQQS